MDGDLTSFLATYGAVVASILAIREFILYRRRITIILEHISFVERKQIIITNSGNRPITIDGIEVQLEGSPNNNQIDGTIPRGILFETTGPNGEDLGYPFPRMLQDGESFTIALTQNASDQISKWDSKINITATDSEGKPHKGHKTRTFDAKWGVHY